MKEKGTFGQECNRGCCNQKPAFWYNQSTLKYYCLNCAELINSANRDVDGLHGILYNRLCIPVRPEIRYYCESSFIRMITNVVFDEGDDLNCKIHYFYLDALGNKKEETTTWYQFHNWLKSTEAVIHHGNTL